MESPDKKIQAALAGLYNELKTPEERKAAEQHLITHFPELANQLEAFAPSPSEELPSEQHQDHSDTTDKG